MNIFKKIYARSFQAMFKIALPFLPYRKPKKLDDNQSIVNVLNKKNKQNALLVTDKVLTNLKLHQTLVAHLKNNNINCFVFNNVNANPTTQNVKDGNVFYTENNCDCIIALGGGSVMDCAKAIGATIVKPQKTLAQMKGLLNVCKKLPLFIAIPTTAGTGSEATIAAVITDENTKHKYVINDFNLIPHYAMLDASLTLNLPKNITATTGIDALTHAIEAYIGKTTTRKTRKYALESIKLIFENLENAFKQGSDVTARVNMLEASYLAGLAFTKSYVGYVHAIAHSLGGEYNVPHGLANAVILPYMLNKYGTCIHKKLEKIAKYCNFINVNTSREDACRIFMDNLNNMYKKLAIPKTIKQLNKNDIDKLATYAAAEGNPLYPVPKLMDKDELSEVYLQLLEKGDK